MRGWLLGSGGGIPMPERATCSALLCQGTHALLIDAGTGVAHLLREPALMDTISTLDVVLTHFHLDHVVGLAFLPSVPLDKPACIHGPGDALYGSCTRDILATVLGPPFLARGWDLPSIAADVRDVGPGSLELGPFTISIRVQTSHSDPTLALRINDDVAYCTDTAYDEGNIPFAAGAQVLCHEAWDVAGTRLVGHSSAADAARVARHAGVKRLVIIHVNPAGNEAAVEIEAGSMFPESRVGRDLMPIVP